MLKKKVKSNTNESMVKIRGYLVSTRSKHCTMRCTKPATNPKTSYYYSQRQLLLAKPATRKTNYSQRQLLEKTATRDGSYAKPATTSKTS
jgi:hypothetical protein